MEEEITISKEAPEQKSMNFTLLREEGLKYIQKIAGKVWTDYNTHDPGITILEVLCYALTDLGYRTSYNIQDILARDPENATSQEIHNFYTASKILPNSPVTLKDYRKLIIDVDIYDPADVQCEYAGVKNAWIEMADNPEVEIYVDEELSKLQLKPTFSGQEPVDMKTLYNVLLEFDRCEGYGDLNDNKIVDDLIIKEHASDPELEGLIIRIEVEFPRWDANDFDWDDTLNIIQAITRIQLIFINLDDNYRINYEITPSNQVVLSGSKNTATGPQPIDNLHDIDLKINNFIYGTTHGLIAFYRKKITRIKGILEEVKSTLYNNRNLCEDFVKFNALRIEEILLCADIELKPDADTEETQALIYHQIAKFLSPTVFFYTLKEIFTRCQEKNQYNVVKINADEKKFTIDKVLQEPPEKDSIISIIGSNNNEGKYTIAAVITDSENEGQTDIFVNEAIPSDIVAEDEKLYLGDWGAVKCTPTEKVFEGPKLKHGFIDDDELQKADRKKVIHVSDLIQIIMDVPGVIAVKNIQIANVPQDNEDTAIQSKSVKWCLQLAFDQNYVPRLNTKDSKITFYKDQLPFRAKQLKVDALLEELQAGERVQKLRNPILDISVPKGNYRDIESYYSIQNDFPQVYGIGEGGLTTVSKNLPNQAQARQLKGFLMFFDQLLANYLSQLSHVKDLFSMSALKDEFGNFIIGRTYYTQPLFDIVPNVNALYVDKAGHEVALNDITEDPELFGKRRNKFLDHLMARFSEQFTDYALLTYQISGAKAPEELIKDKLAFLNKYPAISSERSLGFNYKDPCQLWHIDNISGFEKRASFLLGVDERLPSSLVFSPRFKITGSEPALEFVIENDTAEDLLKSPNTYTSYNEVKEALEILIINGSVKDRFSVKTNDDVNWYFQLLCNGQVIAESVKTDFTSSLPGGDADQAIDEVVALIRNEFFTNPESNRHNLTCPLFNYFEYTISLDMAANPPTFTVDYQLYKNAFEHVVADMVLEGSYTETGDAKGRTDIINIDTATSTFKVKGNIAENLVTDDVLVVNGSGASDGSYTIASFGVDGDDTEIEVYELIPSDAAPFGSLYFNVIKEADLNLLAESKVHDILWKLVASGVNIKNYSFDPATAPFTSPYKFQIYDLGGNLLAESVDFDFNNDLADEVANMSSGKVKIKDSTDNDTEYNVVNAVAKGPGVEVTVDPAPDSGIADGDLSFTENYALTGIDKAAQSFQISEDITGKLKAGDIIFIVGSESNDRQYTIVKITYDGSESSITVHEKIPAEDIEGNLSYTKSFKITKISGNTITVKGGADDQAVEDMISFFKLKFFSHEGLHVIEHILLRPKVNEVLFFDIPESSLKEDLSDDGELILWKKYTVQSADSSTKTFVISGDITADLTGGMTINISGSFSFNGDYTVKTVAFNGSDTEISVEETLFANIEIASAEGYISYLFTTPITAVNASDKKITVESNLADVLASESVVEITGSENGANDGKFTFDNAADAGSNTEIKLKKKESLIQDRLLTINLDENCDCVLDDPYTCIAHIILPYWPGRFINNDFRKFSEKTLRLEAPAHVFLNICWVSCSHMAEFELKYKTWLIENARIKIDKVKLAESLGELIESIENLRNVYPVGTLHDCDEDENLENSIILDNSVLGEI